VPPPKINKNNENKTRDIALSSPCPAFKKESTI
jgi:hypothetical protein